MAVTVVCFDTHRMGLLVSILSDAMKQSTPSPGRAWVQLAETLLEAQHLVSGF